MISKYCDRSNPVIQNFISSKYKEDFGMGKIDKLFTYIKNSIYYDPNSPLQKASETLVMGRGNNFDKNMLLYTLFKVIGYNCCLKYYVAEDRTKRISGKFIGNIPWFYVEVNFFNRMIKLDCSFDIDFLKASNIVAKEKDCNDIPQSYYIEDTNIFKLIETYPKCFSEEILTDFYPGRIHHRIMNVRRASYV